MKATIQGYSRTVKPGHRLLVVTCVWRPGDISLLHDHSTGDDRSFHGIVVVRKGTLFQIEENGTTTFYETGARFAELSDGFRHVVGNCGTTIAESVHVYWPSLVMNTFPYPDEVLAQLANLGLEVGPVSVT